MNTIDMKDFELEKMNLEVLTIGEMQDVNGGILLGFFNLLKEGIEFVSGEIVDFGEGFSSGFNTTV